MARPHMAPTQPVAPVSTTPVSLRKRPVALSVSYDTSLSPEEETAYQTWAVANGRERDTEDYDMRGAWKEGVGQAANGHFPDTYKKPNHPTFSVESKYATPDAGRWEGDTFIAGPANLRNRTADELRAYFAEREPGVVLVLPATK